MKLRACLVAMFCGLGIAVASLARAAEQDFQYGLLGKGVTCRPIGGYGQETRFFLYSNIVKYCPYGPQPNWNADAQPAIAQAAQAVCGGGQAIIWPNDDAWDGAMSLANAQTEFTRRANCTNNGSGNPNHWNGCQVIAWTPTLYSTYNNPANCHP